ncbi:hypothetical protein GCM10022225_54690 [Plantactinospora mayteni]|uniref:HTH luxR-type domain-containing protein n=1 Tax=Plantactinospora mayteni TaxID=566021 RepID=A0ABQ4ELL7_9ACTN|nr:LuxR C-terminal-related transcriptional regulator [Plantactinospora mayteni]GIG95087.1 hypothetical protein Pma05_16600 [Plantactinospora mayteni]
MVTATQAGQASRRPGHRRGADGRRRDRLAALTTRESEILRLVAEGLSNAEVGRRLRMSEMTIKTYVSRILAKLDCTNRVQAALLARDAGPTPWH